MSIFADKNTRQLVQGRCRQLGGVDVQVNGVGKHQAEAQAERIAVDVAAAQVEQPCHLVQCRYQHGVAPH